MNIFSSFVKKSPLQNGIYEIRKVGCKKKKISFINFINNQNYDYF